VEHCPDEEEILSKYEKPLADVAEMSDTYTKTACEVCDQLRRDVRSLKSYEGTKGFDSSKMTEAIEMMYRTKTQREDLDEFLESMLICKCCLDKLRKDKEVARSTINYLAVDKTPDCIQQLNIFERSLIKFCVTSITVVRLGQVTNTRRPRNELNAALKGQ